MRILKEDPLVITSLSFNINPTLTNFEGLEGRSLISFPVTTKFREDGKFLMVEGTLMVRGVGSEEKEIYSASCTGRVAFWFMEPLTAEEKAEDFVYGNFIKPVYHMLSFYLQHNILYSGLVTSFPIAEPPFTTGFNEHKA